ncbi:HAMP domain-containing protein [Halovenus sp. WSH3]|uniref:HAMP domain-containing protein n=1 Tax=Halovenus carboxidivorans TaxID=2692199 RepID=A0A6B0T114_9EURY|nr:methyl-accepting chemotaxis protein [Halovenus carboxidivorans]MXR51888.1 HAMP domain-containing protein [Halovenus carboxidivorans]
MDSYRLRFALALSVIFLITLGGGAAIYLTVDDQLTTETEQRLVSTAEDKSHQTAVWFERTDQLLRSSVRSSAISRNETAFRIWDQLTRVSNRKAISSTHLVDLNTGESVVTAGETSGEGTNGTLPRDAQSRISGLTAPDGAEVRYSEPLVLDGQPAMLAVRETPGPDERALVAVIQLRRLSNQLFSSAYEETATTVSVVNASGITVLSSDTEEILQRDQTWDKDGYSGAGFEANAGGGEFAVGHAGFESRDWVVTNRVPTAQAFSLRSAVRTRLAVLFAVLLVGLAGFGLTVGRTTIRSVRSLAASAQQLSGGDLETEIESDRSDEFGTVFESLEQLRRSLKSKIEAVENERDRAQEAKTTAEEAQREAERERERIETMHDRLAENARSYSAVMASAAEGDLTQRMDPDSQNPAMAEIAESFNEMMTDLEATFGEIQRFADAVDASSAEAASGAEEIRLTSETVGSSIQRIATQADDQRDSLETLSTEMSHHADATSEAAATAETVAELSADAATTAENGERTARQSTTEMEQVQDSMAAAVENVQRLADRMDEIDEIVALIREIASETNMLALNANIEAARPDADGDGFAVVADEVKQLAEKTHSSATDVAELIEEVQQTTDETVAEIRTADDRVERTTAAVDETVEAFASVLEAIERTDDRVREIDDLMASQASRSEEIDEIVARIEQQSRSTASDADEVSAAAQEQTAAVSQVDASIDTLRSRAERLQQTLETFETRAEPDPSPQSAPPLSPD